MKDNLKRLGMLLIVGLFMGSIIGVTIMAARSSQDTKTQSEIQSEIQAKAQAKASEAAAKEREKAIAALPVESEIPSSADRITTLKTEDIIEGTGEVVKETDTIKVKYRGVLAKTSQKFDGNWDKKDEEITTSFPLSSVIEGWKKGVPGMKAGGTRRIYIPAAQAYGSTGSNLIPSDSDLIFDVKIIAIIQAPAAATPPATDTTTTTETVPQQ